MSSGMVPLELSKDNNQYCKISVFMPNAGSINESVISVTNVGGDSFSVAVSMIRWNANKVFCKLINGTKISNINMYYTVDTERFCFYIKANWYAKIIVSRLGLVNTSKIESINAIPSGAIEVPISWRDKRYSTDLGELLGNPKGTKSFSSWSEFTDFVNEMPIKTIQPFVSNFNAFAGEGFYGNVVQGLVIKQLEDAVFIFGIAIDGTLIFRKRNYPDVSTWEDPKIIIHSNNWHKIYFVTDLGELIGINDLKRDATIARNSAGANDSYYYNIIPSNVVKCSYLVEILEDRSQPKIYIVSKYYSNYKNDYNVKGVVVGSSMLSVKFFYNDNGDIILSIVASTRSSLVSVKLLCGDSMPSITKIETPSGLTGIPIS